MLWIHGCSPKVCDVVNYYWVLILGEKRLLLIMVYNISNIPSCFSLPFFKLLLALRLIVATESLVTTDKGNDLSSSRELKMCLLKVKVITVETCSQA